MTPRGNLAMRPSRSAPNLTAVDYDELRPQVETLAGEGWKDWRIAERLRTPARPMTAGRVRFIRTKFNIGPGEPAAVTAKEPTAAERKAAARRTVAELIIPWVAAGQTDRDVAQRLNNDCVPTLTGSGQWTRNKVEQLRKRCGIPTVYAAPVPRIALFRKPRGHETHCSVCDAIVDHENGTAPVHKKLVRITKPPYVRAEPCEGSGQPVVCKPTEVAA